MDGKIILKCIIVISKDKPQ